MKTALKIFIIVLLVLILCLGWFVSCTPTGRRIWNGYQEDIQKADDATSYETKKQVEDTCRSMIASYNSDKLTYEQYNDSDSKEKQNWAEQAKTRANKTASSYNEFILKNNYVWKNDVPSDIYETLPYVE